jgi:hypothetical protein
MHVFLVYYITKHLFTETSGKQRVLWPLDRRCCPRLRLGQQRGSLVHKTHCFPRSHSACEKSEAKMAEIDVQ